MTRLASARRTFGPLALALCAATGAGAQGSAGASIEAGAYLAARAAARAFDFAAGAEWFGVALAAEPADAELLEGAMAAELGRGRFEAAASLADRLAAAGRPIPLAQMVRFARWGREGAWDRILADLDAGRGAGPLLDGLARGWALTAQGDAEAGLAAFDAVAALPGLRAVGPYHKALALAQAGDLAGAEAVLAEAEDVQRTRRAVQARAEVLGALGRADEALAAIETAFGADPGGALGALRARLRAGEAVGFDLVGSPAEGLAEALLTLGGAVAAEDDGGTALMYARAALGLDPGRTEAALLAGGRLEALGRSDLAQAAFALVPPADPLFPTAELGRAASLRRAGQGEAAADALARLAESHPDLAEAHVALGDALRGLDRPAEAEAAYGRAIDHHREGDGALWFIHYARALAREGQGDWPGAEADLRRALLLRPDEPQILNNLGYGLVDRGEALDEALALLDRAAALRPESGAIVDSLGWAHYRLGRYDEAVAELERAATLVPTDPVVNDHLGDAYWRVGRIREARFQWSRALAFGPDEAAAGRLRAKLAEGLDAAEATEERAPARRPVARPSGAAGEEPGG